MAQRETIAKRVLTNALHIPGDYARGMTQIGEGGLEGFITGQILTTALSFGVGGMIGMIGSLALLSSGVVPYSHDLPGIGWWTGAGIAEAGVTVGATVLGNFLRRER